MMDPGNSQIIAIERTLLEMGVFEARRLAIIGKDLLSEEVASLCASRGMEVFLFSRQPPGYNMHNIKYFIFEDDKGRNRWSNLQHILFVIVLSCSANIIEEVLRAAPPFCRIIFFGPIDGIIDNMDFYSTVHINNLELIFQPLRAGEIS